MAGAKKKSRIPEFPDVAAAATFWDTHSSEDFPDEFEDVEVEFSPELKKRGRIRRALLIELDDEAEIKIAALAKQEGVTSEQLVHRWIGIHLKGA